MRRKLTKLLVDRIGPPKTGRLEIWDTLLPGFGMRVTDKGSRSYFAMFRVGGRLRRLTLGDARVVDLDEARELARAALQRAARGEDPTRPRDERASRGGDTVAAAIAAFLADERARGLRAVADTEGPLRREFLGQVREGSGTERTWVNGKDRLWRDRPVREIERRDIVQRLDDIKRRAGKHAARHALAAIRKFFNWCEEGERFGVVTSPCARIRDKTIGVTGRDLKRQRVLDNAELKDVWLASEGLCAYGSVVRLLMLTGQRVSDIARAKWSEIDLKEATLAVPPERYKTGIGQLVPLPPLAIALFEDQPRSKRYVFTTTGGAKPINGFSKAKDKLDAAIAERREKDRREPMPAWILHDLRRTVRTRLVSDLGVDAFIAERVLGHALPGLHGVYDQGSHRPQKREALERWATRLVQIIGQAPTSGGAQVIPSEEVKRRREKRA